MSIFPHYSKVCAIKNKGALSDNRGRSLWLGFSQSLLNMPRLVLTGIIGGVWVAAIGLVMGLVIIAWRGIVHPILAIFCVLTLGFAGKLTTVDRAGDYETLPLSPLKGRKS